ncbi:hypothetical protein [Enterobacter sp.]|uniref:ApeA N-terminal domain 1-containing protein n=1 Tax=Enterobacter sp. TaxID=42895 RepID=UPI003784E76A
MDEINYYTDNVSEIITGYVTIDGKNIFSELEVNADGISIRIIDFNDQLESSLFDLSPSHPIIFTHITNHYLLFGLELNKFTSLMEGFNETVRDYTLSAQGFIYTKDLDIKYHQEFYSISLYGEGLKKWSGSTMKIGNIIKNITNHHRPNDEDLIEFEKKIVGVGSIGLYNSFRYGGINGLHSFGLEIEPHIKFHFEQPVNLEQLIKTYTDLYMILRFFIGDSISISDVKISSIQYLTSQSSQLYIPEKKVDNINHRNGMLLPFSSPFNDSNENNFPEVIWENYFSPEHKDIKELLQKYVTYSMINNYEEQFLGFYRIIESMTLEISHFVDETELDELLNRSKVFLSKQFPKSSIPKFIRAIKNANRGQNNTERCIHHFIKSLPQKTIEILKLNEIDLSEICKSRNKMIHQPLFIETSEKIHNHKKKVEILTKLALLVKLGVPENKINYMAYYL